MICVREIGFGTKLTWARLECNGDEWLARWFGSKETTLMITTVGTQPRAVELSPPMRRRVVGAMHAAVAYQAMMGSLDSFPPVEFV